jgi:hypothetical protein
MAKQIDYPYAHDLVLGALDVVIAGYADAANIKPREQVGLGAFRLQHNKMYYDPAVIMNIPFNQLIEVVHSVYISYHLSCVPRCSKFPYHSELYH